MDGGPGPFTWPVPTAPIEVPPSKFWKSSLAFPDEPFAHGNQWEDVRWVKFTVLMRDPSKVYFQDSVELPFHYPFATAHLPPFDGMTTHQFDAVTLHEAGQEAILGAVLLPPKSQGVNEVGIQLVRKDAYHPELVRLVFEKVREAIQSERPPQAFYFPTFEQQPSAEAHETWLAARGVPLSSADRWSEFSQCYSPGWSFGRLVQLSGPEIDGAYAEGRLKATDILLTDGVPAELPPLAGILTTRPTTPNSHVAILAATTRTPFAYLASPSEAQSATALAGQEVVLTTRGHRSMGSACRVSVFRMDPGVDPGLRAQLTALKAPPTIDLVPKASLGALQADTLTLGPADVRYFGGKAAHFGLLRRSIPDNTFQAIAFSFDLWDGFMAQTLPGGATLSREIATRLQGLSSYPPPLPELKEALAGIRLLIRNEASFSPQTQADVKAALGGFSSTRNIRFRSSTNVEDAADFSGAGLYDSYSGCLQDDLDSDDLGPSACDPTETEERGVFRALRRVFASFYNDNAYLERLRHGVDETQVGMAVLVHHSTPDDLELANGVATLTEGSRVHLVTQLGAAPVTNPSGTALPEVVTGFVSSGPSHMELVASSSLVPLGASVMAFPADHSALAALLMQVRAEFRRAYPSKTRFTLDFEFKKLRPDGKLYVKQVRELPQPDTTPSIDPVLLNAPRRLCVLQGEFADAFAIHRLKTRLNVNVKNVRLTAAERQSSLFGMLDLEVFDGAEPAAFTGLPSTWPGAAHAVDGEAVLDSFRIDGSLPRRLSLSMSFPQLVAPAAPLLTPRDADFLVQASYDAPQPTIDWSGPSTTTEETARLFDCWEDSDVTEAFLLQERLFQGPQGLSVRTSFYWPPPPTGITAGYTAPLVKWVQTELHGLTTAPLVLSGYWSQTYRPDHHNFDESFLFEPALEPGVSEAQRAELSAKDVKLLHVYGTPSSATFHVVGLNGAVRALP